MSHKNSKCRHFASVQMKQIEWPVFHYVFHPILMQTEDIWNFHGSLTLNKAKEFDILEAFGIPLHQI